MPKLFLMFFFQILPPLRKARVFVELTMCLLGGFLQSSWWMLTRNTVVFFPLPSCLTFHLCFIPESVHSLALSPISIIQQCVIWPGCFVALCLEQSWLMRVNLAQEVTQTEEWIGTVDWIHWKQTFIIPIFFNSLQILVSMWMPIKSIVTNTLCKSNAPPLWL